MNKNTRSLSVVKKNIRAIHIEAKLSLVERKLYNALLFNAYEDLPKKTSYDIDIKTLCLLIGFDSKNLSPLKDSISRLRTTEVKWNILDENGNEEWGVTGLISEGKIHKGVLRYEYSSTLRKNLYNPDIYARINLSVLRTISSSHAMAIYENCLRFLKTGSTGFIDVETWRRLLGVQDEKTYNEFKFFNVKILKPAIYEINRVTNIHIEPEFKKDRRAITAIRFLVKENHQLNLLDFEQEDEISKSLAYKTLIEKGISKIMARQWIIEHGEDYILEKLEVTQHAKARGGLKSESGFLIKAVSENYTDAVVVEKKAVVAAQEKKAQKQQKERTAQKIQKDILAIEKAHREACNNLIGEKLAEISSEDEKSLFTEIKAQIQGAINLKEFTQRRWRSILNDKLIRETFSKRLGLRFPMQDEIAKVLNLPPLEKLRAMKDKYSEANK